MSNRMVRLSSILLRPVPHSQSMVNPSKLWPSHDHSPPNLRPMTSDHHTIALTILLNVLYISWYSYVLIVVRSRLLYIMHSIIDHLLILLSSNPLVFSRILNHSVLRGCLSRIGRGLEQSIAELGNDTHTANVDT